MDQADNHQSGTQHSGTQQAGTRAFDEEVDVIVLGAGAAGSAAAIAAHDAGATVLLADKGDEQTYGGNTRVSGGGWFTHGSPERAATFLRSLSAPYAIDDDLVATWAAETAVTSDWMRSLGIDAATSPVYHTRAEYADLPDIDGADCQTGMDTIGGEMGNHLMIDAFRTAIDARADRLDLRLSTRARALLTDDSGAVVGVEFDPAPGGDRQPTTVRARGGVVLATGGFSADPGLVADHLGLTGHSLWGSPLSTGDGLRMALDVGADLINMANMMATTGIARAGTGPLGDGVGGAGMFLANWNANSFVYVGDDGRRFVDETATNRHGHTRLSGIDQIWPRHSFWLVCDEPMIQAGPMSPPPALLPVGWSMLEDGIRWSDDNRAEIEAGTVLRAATIGELAERIGVDGEVLADTLTAYNDGAQAGKDLAHGRAARRLTPLAIDGPLYAIRVVPLLGWSNGGPRRDGRARVLDRTGSVIAGLWAAGEVASSYPSRKDGGFHIADALAMGRFAGRDAAQNAVTG